MPSSLGEGTEGTAGFVRSIPTLIVRTLPCLPGRDSNGHVFLLRPCQALNGTVPGGTDIDVRRNLRVFSYVLCRQL